MAETTGIEWAHSTFNGWIGCQKVSAACDFCYAETLMDTRLGRVEWGPGKPRRRTSEAYWRQPYAWNRKAEASGKPWRVFCASLADVFDNAVNPQWRADLWQVIDDTPHLTWMLLTKRPQNIRKMAPADSWPENVWLGISAEDQEAFGKRWGALAAEKVGVTFISYEPALGWLNVLQGGRLPDWVIAGGESGHNARPAHPDWFRSMQHQCARANIAFLFKQWGEWAPFESTADLPIGKNAIRTDHFPDGRVGWWARLGKKRAGRLLDGREWNEFPA